MKEKWTYRTFGEVGSFLRGKSIQKADFVEHGMPCIHYGQIHTTFGVSVDKHLSEIPLELYNKSIIASPGDVIIAITSVASQRLVFKVSVFLDTTKRVCF